MHTFKQLCAACLFLSIPLRAVCEESLSSFLTHMPQNSEKRCVGIAGVAEALLEGQRTDRETSVNALAHEIYHNFTSDKIVRFPSRLDVGKLRLQIDDLATLEALSTGVAELYKADYRRWSEIDSGTQKLIAAQARVVKSRAELDELLQADPDRTVFFCCFGSRSFPSGKVNQTSHAVLIKSSPNGGYRIFDPNDPGTPIQCVVKETPEGLALTWQCQYRDRAIQTTQEYLIVPQARYFATFE